MLVLDGELVWAWLAGVVVWPDGGLVCAWLVELFEAGACVVLVPVPELDDWPAVDGCCVRAEFAEGLVPDGLDGVVDEDWGVVVVDVESCRCAVGEFEFEVLGDDCANADVAIATAAVVARNKRLFI